MLKICVIFTSYSYQLHLHNSWITLFFQGLTFDCPDADCYPNWPIEKNTGNAHWVDEPCTEQKDLKTKNNPCDHHYVSFWI